MSVWISITNSSTWTVWDTWMKRAATKSRNQTSSFCIAYYLELLPHKWKPPNVGRFSISDGLSLFELTMTQWLTDPDRLPHRQHSHMESYFSWSRPNKLSPISNSSWWNFPPVFWCLVTTRHRASKDGIFTIRRRSDRQELKHWDATGSIHCLYTFGTSAQMKVGSTISASHCNRSLPISSMNG